MAREVLNEKYPYLMTAPSSSSSTSSSPIQSLDTNKTYIFELIHPQNPTHVRYTYKDLVLLSIVGKDGSEPPPDFNWSIYPFPRPTYHDIPISDFPAIQRLNRSNEEGFIVKIYPLPSSTSTSPFSFHPQRIKVKFESYLELIKSKNYIIGGGDQTPNELAEVYRRKRGFIYTFDEAQVVRRMGQDKDAYFDSVRRISDDFGGPEWVNGLMDMWNEAETAFMEAEAELLAAMNRLMADGFEAQVGTEDVDVKRRFAQRIMQEPEMSRHKNTLFAWFGGGPIEKQVAMFVSSVKVNSRKEQTKKTKE
ncbi:hypothetical protein D9757_009985 [Collybiopsis confluens]|uniref:Uncharacterized protein n=1 Tax=Collybiopsis confluens TaxID=2823264 RepID=A0A8H5LVZ6_9AGAR|nr:hypothetical protein D9757_009985 [Collybiopsis confluens]